MFSQGRHRGQLLCEARRRHGDRVGLVVKMDLEQPLLDPGFLRRLLCDFLALHPVNIEVLLVDECQVEPRLVNPVKGQSRRSHDKPEGILDLDPLQNVIDLKDQIEIIPLWRVVDADSVDAIVMPRHGIEVNMGPFLRVFFHTIGSGFFMDHCACGAEALFSEWRCLYRHATL